ncbi:hypothetical protein D3C85_1444230 [compost metagenome]
MSRAARLGFIAHAPDRLRAGPDENGARREDGFGEIGVLREKAITGMDRIGPRGFQGCEQCFDVQVTFVGAGGTEQVHLVGHARSLGVEVRFAARGNGGDTQCFGGADNPHGNLATVGDQQFTNALSHDRALTRRRVLRRPDPVPPDRRLRPEMRQGDRLSRRSVRKTAS